MRINKLFYFLLFVLCGTIFSPVVYAEKVATIDLSMAVSLHPRMSLFDFDRMGFYKVEPGLPRAAFDEAVAKLKGSEKSLKVIEDQKKLEEKLSELDRQKSILVARLSEPGIKDFAATRDELENLAADEKQLQAVVADLEHAVACPDLTDLATTRKMLAEIETEILAAVSEVAEHEKFDLVLNASVPVPYGYPVRYQSGEMYGQGVPGINFSLFYAFLAKANLAHPQDETPPSRDLINWLELTRYPDAVNLLPIRPYPLVLSGGHCILSKVMNRVYLAHKVDPEVFKVVDSVINKIDELNKPDSSLLKH